MYVYIHITEGPVMVSRLIEYRQNDWHTNLLSLLIKLQFKHMDTYIRICITLHGEIKCDIALHQGQPGQYLYIVQE